MSERAKHTPAPWSATIEVNAVWVEPADGNASVICDLIGRKGDGKDFTEEDYANADLIAAAPDLLAACEQLVAQFDAYRAGWLGAELWRDRIGLTGDLEAARATIAKAGGGQS